MSHEPDQLSNLREVVLRDMADYLATYEPAPPAETVGTAWDRDRVALELDRMRELLVEPYPDEYVCDDSLLPDAERLPKGVRRGFVVAVEGRYAMLFDTEASDFVLVSRMAGGHWESWGIRGDASTFLAR